MSQGRARLSLRQVFFGAQAHGECVEGSFSSCCGLCAQRQWTLYLKYLGFRHTPWTCPAPVLQYRCHARATTGIMIMMERLTTAALFIRSSSLLTMHPRVCVHEVSSSLSLSPPSLRPSLSPLLPPWKPNPLTLHALPDAPPPSRAPSKAESFGEQRRTLCCTKI